MPQSRTIRLLLLGALAAATVVLTGCNQLTPLPPEERYQYIHEARDKLDYSSVGEVVSEEYDDNSGFLGTSYLEVTLSGEGVFEELSPRVQEISDQKCSITSSSVNCILNRPRIDLFASESGVTTLRLSDSQNGRG